MNYLSFFLLVVTCMCPATIFIQSYNTFLADKIFKMDNAKVLTTFKPKCI